jgi:hypothetical protein
MKKLLLVGVLALAMGAWLHAEGLTVTGNVRTGMDVRIGNQYHSWPESPEFRFGNWDNRTDLGLNMVYSRGNYGFRFMPRWRLNHGAPGAEGTTYNNFRFAANVHGWVSFADDMVLITAGLVDSNPWANFGGGWDGQNYAQGTGVRVELRPMDGLNVGFFLRPWHTSMVWPETNVNRLSYALANTSFGARFAPADGPIGIAAGLELRSRYQNRPNVGYHDFSMGAANVRPGAREIGDHINSDFSNLGVRAYLGAGINVIDALTLEVAVEAFNLDDFNHSGYIFTTQVVGFDMSPLQVGVDFHQLFLTGYQSRFQQSQDNDVRVVLLFEPHVGFDITSDTRATFAVPFDIAPNWNGDDTAFGFTLAPGITHMLTPGLQLYTRYRMNFNNGGGQPGSNSEIGNRLNVQLNWTF